MVIYARAIIYVGYGKHETQKSNVFFLSSKHPFLYFLFVDIIRKWNRIEYGVYVCAMCVFAIRYAIYCGWLFFYIFYIELLMVYGTDIICMIFLRLLHPSKICDFV